MWVPVNLKPLKMLRALNTSLAVLLIALLLPVPVASAQDEDILRPEAAYRYAVADTGETIEIDWVVEEGYYTVVGETPASMDLVIKSQGCADIGLCYPPQTWIEPVALQARKADGAKLQLGNSGTFGTFVGANADFLPVDEAFQPVLTVLDGNTVEVAFRVLTASSTFSACSDSSKIPTVCSSG